MLGELNDCSNTARLNLIFIYYQHGSLLAVNLRQSGAWAAHSWSGEVLTCRLRLDQVISCEENGNNINFYKESTRHRSHPLPLSYACLYIAHLQSRRAPWLTIPSSLYVTNLLRRTGEENTRSVPGESSA